MTATYPRRDLLDREGLFAPLSAAERDELAPKLRRRPFAASDVLVRQGDLGNSLFLIVEGHLAALFAPKGQRPDDEPLEAGRLGPGDCFGEMALLTGAVRSATVVARTPGLAYEVAKPDIAPILKARPEIAAQLGLLLAHRQSVLDAIAAEHPDLDRRDAGSLGGVIAKWIMAGFSITPGTVI